MPSGPRRGASHEPRFPEPRFFGMEDPRVPMTDPSPATTPDPGGTHWSRAEARSLAAVALLEDPSVPPWTAAGQLREGFAALAAEAGLSGSTPAALATAVEDGALPCIPEPDRLKVAADLRGLALDDDAALDDAAPLLRLADALAAAVRAVERRRFGPQIQRDARRQLWRRLGMAVLVLIPVTVLLVLTVPDYREGPWHAQYFSTPDFGGEPVVRRDGDIKFKWRRRSPSPDLIPEDGFSARWDTCMELPEALSIAFQLVSDDGSRLLIDGELVIDNWGRHGERSRGEQVPLTAGIHHVRVEYFDQRHDASVTLSASLHGERPDSLPVRILHYPGEEPDPDDPCAVVRAERSGG